MLSGTVYRLASSMSEYTPVQFNVFEDCNEQYVVPHISFASFVIRPVESHSGARGPVHYRGALSQPHCHFISAKIETPVRKRGHGCPLTIRLWVWESVASYKLPSKVRWSPRKWILCIFQVRKKPSGTPFSVFSSDGGAPQTSRGPGKLPLSLLSTGLFVINDFNN